ncbi:SDR family oxidoreductase [Methylobacterium sp. WL103]|uniref:SDR family oxidoreductase n=1 Tax=unclassified Methylobacterium TaxID=2615210 RepID=UPI0011C9E033|nr:MULTISPECIES: SDR family oxidoreductase [unclassified Methylobacterium]TXM72052.1 SDR family oxidoreductase [Methylobacterium sp. WL12]TXM91905.1 SDR family oxidoreductase [Methylobacterium sp. WL103]
MFRSRNPLGRQVVVITGASSGIGLATARMAAERGAKVVLAARSGDALARIESEIKAAGGQAIQVVADVGDRADVDAIAEAAIARFSRIDTWVNDAGLSIFGKLEEVVDADNKRLFATNFWGVVNGSLAAVPHLKRTGGVLINLGSVASDVAFPLQGMYCASKHAIKGFTDALRIELEEEGAGVAVTLIKPAAIDTPFPQNAKNYTDRAVKLPPPVYRTEEVANAIVHAAVHPQRDIYIGGGGRLMSAAQRLAPRAFDRIGRTMIAQQLRDEPARGRAGALHQAGGASHEAGSTGRTSGDHPGYVMRRSFYTRSTLHPLASSIVAVGAVLAATSVLAGNRRR